MVLISSTRKNVTFLQKKKLQGVKGTEEMLHLTGEGGPCLRLWIDFDDFMVPCLICAPFDEIFFFLNPHPLFFKHVKHWHAWCLWSIIRAKEYYF